MNLKDLKIGQTIAAVKKAENPFAHAKTISISAKCSDLFSATVTDASGKTIIDYEGYVPGFFPDEHYGDYIMLDIDLATGKITNWKKPTPEILQKDLVKK